MSQQLPEKQRDFAIYVVEKLRAAGYEALWAGGCVRDQLMGIEPKDYDVATEATPDQVREVFGHRRTLPIGASFGVITVLGPKQAGQIEVATFRRDESYSDGRRPDAVSYTHAEEDAQRRDFTINGLFYDPIKNEVIDYIGGQDDLNRKIVRAIGDPQQRFDEDKLRMLRAVRFTATFDFQMQQSTFDAVRSMASQITVVSVERIAAEIRRMLTHGNRAGAVRLLREIGLLAVILPKLSECFDRDVAMFERTLALLEKLNQPSFPVALAALLLESFDPKIAGQLAHHWKLANAETDRCSWLLKEAKSLDHAQQEYWPKLQRILIHQGIGDLISLTKSRVELGSCPRESLEFVSEKLAQTPQQLNPPPLLTGNDLIEHGLQPGKKFKYLLHEVRDAQLLNKIASKAEAVQLAEKLLQDQGSDATEG